MIRFLSRRSFLVGVIGLPLLLTPSGCASPHLFDHSPDFSYGPIAMKKTAMLADPCGVDLLTR